jgi:hypothetical protein
VVWVPADDWPDRQRRLWRIRLSSRSPTPATPVLTWTHIFAFRLPNPEPIGGVSQPFHDREDFERTGPVFEQWWIDYTVYNLCVDDAAVTLTSLIAETQARTILSTISSYTVVGTSSQITDKENKTRARYSLSHTVEMYK